MSFRQYGGINYAARNNIVKNNFTNANNLSVMNKVGQPDSVINSDSDININGVCQANSFISPSDYRIKENVLTLNDSSFTVDNLRPVTYTNKLLNKQDMGFIAHELQEHYPFLVTGEKDGPVNQSVNYIGLISLLVKEIQQLKQDIKILKMK